MSAASSCLPSDLLALVPAIKQQTGQTPPMLEPGKVSGFLIELAPGATELQLRFALLAQLSGIKVISGGSLLTGIRQGITALLGGAASLVSMMFASTALLVSVLFSAIITERRGELGLLKAIGAKRAQIVGMVLTEAILATGIGGLCGVVFGMLLLRVFEHSLVYYLTEMGVPFFWLDPDKYDCRRSRLCFRRGADRRNRRANAGLAREPARSLRFDPWRGMRQGC